MTTRVTSIIAKLSNFVNYGTSEITVDWRDFREDEHSSVDSVEISVAFAMRGNFIRCYGTIQESIDIVMDGEKSLLSQYI